MPNMDIFLQHCSLSYTNIYANPDYEWQLVVVYKQYKFVKTYYDTELEVSKAYGVIEKRLRDNGFLRPLHKV